MSSSLLEISNMLLITGQQQNVGKTMLACNIISRYSREYPITAFKISPHFHKNTADAEIIVDNAGFQILKEIEIEGKKDTSRMLKSGAEQAFLLQANSDTMKDGLMELLKLVPKNHLIVCESAGVREYLKPGIFIAIRQLYCQVCAIGDEDIFSLADRIVTYTVNGFDFSLSEIEIVNGEWILQK